MTVRRSLAFSFSEKYGSFAMQFAASVVLARLLSPEEIGIFSVGLAVVAVAHSLREFGVTSYLIQERTVPPETITATLVLNFATSWLLAGIVFSSRHWVADFYGEAGLAFVLGILSLNFVLIPFGAVRLALLRREMSFGTICVVNLASAFANAGVGITLAATGHGFRSLAWATLAGTVTTVLLATLLGPKLQLKRPTFSAFRPLLSFSFYSTAISAMRDAAFSARDLTVGKVIGFEGVGIFSRASGLIQVFNTLVMNAIWPVALPHFAQRHREGHDLAQDYLRAVSYITVVGWPFFIGLAFLAHPIILVLFGEQWVEAAPLVRILSIGAMLSVLTSICGLLFISTGRIRHTFIVEAISKPVLLVLIVSASFVSLQAVAASLIANYLILLILWQHFLRRKFGLGWRLLASAVRKSFVVAACSCAIPGSVAVYAGLPSEPLSMITLTTLLGGFFGTIAGVTLTSHPITGAIPAATVRVLIRRVSMWTLLRRHT